MERIARNPVSVLAALLVAGSTGCVEPVRLESRWTALDRPASAEVWCSTERSARALVADFPPAMERVAETMGLDRPDSELQRLNAAAADDYYRVTDRDLFRAVSLGLDYAKASEGAYDPTLGPLYELYRDAPGSGPSREAIAAALDRVGWASVALERQLFAVRFLRPDMRIDLEGMVEGYALDVAARKFVRTGSLAGVLRLSSHVYAWGRPPHGERWSVDVHDPRSDVVQSLVRLRVDSSRGIGVSAVGGPGLPVLDPRTGQPASSDVVVAIVLADSVADAIAVSRAMLVGGTSRAGALLGEKTRRVEAVLLLGPARPSVLASASLQGRLEPTERLLAQAPGGVRFLLPPSELKGRLD